MTFYASPTIASVSEQMGSRTFLLHVDGHDYNCKHVSASNKRLTSV